MLPIGFQTDYIKNIRDIIKELDRIISGQMPDAKKPFLIEFADANSIIDMISETLEMELDWDWEAFKACIEFLSKNTENEERRGKIWCLVRLDRNTSRYRLEAQRFEDRPDSEKDLTDARMIAKDIPVLVLFHQNGLEEKGWRGSPFWWPVLVAPENIRTVIFASDFIEYTDTTQSI